MCVLMCRRCRDTWKDWRKSIWTSTRRFPLTWCSTLLSSYDLLILIYHLNNIRTTLIELHNMLQKTEAWMKKFHSNNFTTTLVMAIQQDKWKNINAHSQPKWKVKAHIGESSGSKDNANFDAPPITDLKEVVCFHCGQKGHWRRSYPKYLKEVR